MPCSALAVQCGESPLTNLASVLYRAFQKHSNKATPGQQYSSRGHSGGSQSWNWVHSVLTFLTYSVVMGLLLRSIAPSATIMIFSLFIPARFYKEGVVEKQHDRKTETVAVTWAFRSTGREPRTDLFTIKAWCHHGLCSHLVIRCILSLLLLVHTLLLRD